MNYEYNYRNVFGNNYNILQVLLLIQVPTKVNTNYIKLYKYVNGLGQDWLLMSKKIIKVKQKYY